MRLRGNQLSEDVACRARSMAELSRYLTRVFVADEMASSVRSYRPRPGDIVISPFGQCGTTWLQQTFHTLRTRGDMDFDDICRVVPWIETARALGLDLDAPQRAEPRGFKSHMSYEQMPKGARYVVSLRDPKDALVSRYRSFEGWLLEPGAVSIADFVKVVLSLLARSGRRLEVWQHLISWWHQRDNPEVLLLSYEHMIADPAANARKLAAFCGIALDDALLALTLERSSLNFMLQHKDRFDDFMLRKLSEDRCNLPPGSDSAKVRKGVVGGHRQELPDELSAAMDEVWTKIVAPRLGFADYASLETELRRRAATRESDG
jgi:hypothetical protein